MTPSDRLLAVNHCYKEGSTRLECHQLISKMNYALDEVHKIVIELEKDPDFKELGEHLRKALES